MYMSEVTYLQLTPQWGNSLQFYACLIQAPRRWGTGDVPKWSHCTRARTSTTRDGVLNMHYASW